MSMSKPISSAPKSNDWEQTWLFFNRDNFIFFEIFKIVKTYSDLFQTWNWAAASDASACRSCKNNKTFKNFYVNRKFNEFHHFHHFSENFFGQIHHLEVHMRGILTCSSLNEVLVIRKTYNIIQEENFGLWLEVKLQHFLTAVNLNTCKMLLEHLNSVKWF